MTVQINHHSITVLLWRRTASFGYNCRLCVAGLGVQMIANAYIGVCARPLTQYGEPVMEFDLRPTDTTCCTYEVTHDSNQAGHQSSDERLR